MVGEVPRCLAVKTTVYQDTVTLLVTDPLWHIQSNELILQSRCKLAEGKGNGDQRRPMGHVAPELYLFILANVSVVRSAIRSEDSEDLEIYNDTPTGLATGDKWGGGHLPLPLKSRKNILYFPGKYHVKFGHFVNFSYI